MKPWLLGTEGRRVPNGIGNARLALVMVALLLTCLPLELPGQDFVITELVAANDAGAVDEDGEHSDWIEIYFDFVKIKLAFNESIL